VLRVADPRRPVRDYKSRTIGEVVAIDTKSPMPMLRERRGQPAYQASADISSRSAREAEKADDVEARVAGRRPEEIGPGLQIPDHRLIPDHRQIPDGRV
jgi:hypothetical protein